MNPPPKVVIVGRTNVGKSTLFNRLIEEQKSLVSSIPGTTRDRFEADCLWRGRVIRLIDTGGLDPDASTDLEQNISKQAELAIAEADIILFVIDLPAGLQPQDSVLARKLSNQKKPIITIGNKVDNPKSRAQIHEVHWELPLPLAISAKHGTGTGDLLDAVFAQLENRGTPPVDIAHISPTRIAVIGRPNVGKSSLLNAIVGEHRFITSDKAHTTREPNDTLVHVDGQDYVFVDTAGVRKLARVHAGKSKLEQRGVERSLRSIKKADVTLLVLDVSKKIVTQDKHLAGRLAAAESSCVIIANKWDLIPDKTSVTINEYEKYLRAHLPMLDYAPILFTSAVTGKRVPNLFDAIDRVYSSRFTQLSDEETKSFISRAIMKHKPSRGKGVAHPTIRSFRQTRVNPPTFLLMIKQRRTDSLAESYLRFLENLLRKHYDFEGTPIRIKVRSRKKKHTT